MYMNHKDQCTSRSWKVVNKSRDVSKMQEDDAEVLPKSSRANTAQAAMHNKDIGWIARTRWKMQSRLCQ